METTTKKKTCRSDKDKVTICSFVKLAEGKVFAKFARVVFQFYTRNYHVKKPSA